MVIEENKSVSRKSIASISKKSATLGAIVLGSAFAVSSLSANIDIPTVEASEGTTVTFASTNNAFLDSIIPDAYKLANDNDLYASVMIAQAILESNWGASGLSAAPYYNLFGIKGTYNGEGVTFYTLEDDGSGNYYQIRDSFRDYPSYKESLNDYANKMVNGVSWDSEFYSGTWKSNTSSYTDATAALTGTYATDTRYGGKLNNLITTHGLTQYDTPAGSTSGTSASVSSATTNLSAQGKTSSTKGGKSYTVKAGDGLYTVARALGVTVAEVKAQNGLTSNLIHPGQVLSVASSSASSSSSSASTETATNTGSSASTSGKSYTVKSGDGLYSVAKALGISVSEARSLNGGSDLIHPGQVFKAATSASEEVAEETTKTGSSASTSGKSYTVKSGDGLYSVAKALGISVSEARSLNSGADLIHPGQVFKAGQSTTSSSSTSSSSSASANTGSSSASTSTGKSYTVKSGDGLYSVAKALGISVSEARALNGGSDLIHPGKVFTAGSSSQASSSQASSSSATSTSSASTSQSSATTSGKSYTVKSGDGIYTVARALGISLAEARALNGGSDLIHPGKVFTAGSSSQASSSQASSSQATSSSATSTSSASTSQSSASTSGNSYTVKSGDGIYTVARALGISLAEARALNGGSDLIHPGKVFTTGGSSQASSSQASSSASTSSSTSTASTSTASSSAISSTKTHTVKSGETLYRIAKNNGLSLDELMTLNGLSNYNLYIGQVLKLN
ncbi:LysM peptidoglycan-binding domain-containing protein [Aerococcus urinaeequi]|uniref:muramidase family protein n=1 Tax=Aerococcus urinaeequi TaxID=51665 RepID=UPI003D6B5EA7